MAKVSLESAQAFVAILGEVKDRAIDRLGQAMQSTPIDRAALQQAFDRHQAAQHAFWAAKMIVDHAKYSGVTEFDETILDAK